MDVLLVSTYELGHQPVHLASPAAALRAAGHGVRCLDLSVDAWDAQAAWWAEAVALSVPMHTAMRLAVRAARELRGVRPALPLAFYGLYAPVSRDLTVRGVADAAIGGEYEPALVRWVDAVAAGGAAASFEAPVVELGRTEFRVPTRNLLPPLDRYAHLRVDGEERPVGAVEASHGCAHECQHCPIPVWYDGRIRLVPRDVVLADIEQLVRMGARHVTFADPDFLNGWRHSLRLVREMHGAFPDLTFDCTTKVEHVLRHADLWPELARSGCLFVVSAFETMNDEVLARLDKGHTAADAARAVEVLRPAGIEIRPSFLPFAPWTTPTDLVDIIDFVVDADLVGNVDPVQYTIRLLLPEGSLLLEHPDIRPHLGPYDAEALTYTWRAEQPAMDALQERLATLVERSAADGEGVVAAFLDVNAAVREAVGQRGALDVRALAAGSVEGRPRLTEPWFC